ncbi:MFS transporter [archaeon]|nr:MAG: MFS transporter [archaeon]
MAMARFDFSVFGALVDIISMHFFPADEGAAVSFLKTVAIFGVAFLMRPLGGLLIGWIGDNYGRRIALEISIVLMLLPSFLIGCLPTYQQVGWLAPVLLLILRMIQGLAAGGELVGALIFTLESTHGRHCGFWGGACKATGNFGSTVGIGVAALLRYLLSEKDMLAWGWRVPFWMGIVFGIMGVIARKSLQFEEEDSQQHDASHPREPYCSYLSKLFKYHASDMVVVVFVTAFWSCSYYTGFVWMGYYMHSPMLIGGDTGIKQAWGLCFAANLLLVVCLPLGGYVGDLLGVHVRYPGKATKTVLQLSIFIMVAVALPAFMLIRTKDVASAGLGLFLLAIPVALFGGNLPVYMITHFEHSLRFSGVGLSYNFAHALFSSTVSLVQTSLILFVSRPAHDSHHQGEGIVDNPHLFPAYYIIFIALVTFLALQCDFGDPYPLLKDRREYTEVNMVTESTAPPFDPPVVVAECIQVHNRV